MALAGKQVLITGGGSGVGADLARAFAGAGARVVIAGRRAEPLESLAATLPGALAVTADVTDEASTRAMFDAAGPCDIVNGRRIQLHLGQLDPTRCAIFKRAADEQPVFILGAT